MGRKGRFGEGNSPGHCGSHSCVQVVVMIVIVVVRLDIRAGYISPHPNEKVGNAVRVEMLVVMVVIVAVVVMVIVVMLMWVRAADFPEELQYKY